MSTVAQIEKKYITIELEDGTLIEDVRITYQDQIAWSRTKRANKWPEDDVPLGNSFLGWHAAKRTGQLPAGTTFEEWRDRLCIDLVVFTDEDESDDREESPTDSTPQS